MNFLNEFVGLDSHEEHRPTTSRQTVSFNDKIQSVLGDMMFANGDAASPKPECVEFMQELLKEQLQLAINQATERAETRKEVQFKFADLLHGFHRHPYFACRFLRYVSDRLMLGSFSSSFDEAPPGLDELQHSHKHADIEQFKSAFKEFDQTGNLSALIDQCLEPDYTDLIKQERQTRIANLTQQMDTSIYNLFTKARRRCFCYTPDRHVSKPFIEWIGKPNLDSYSILILNFLTTEIVSQMVENALSVRANDTRNQTLNGHLVPLDVLHYKGALRRNLGYQTNGNLLFGYVVAAID